ncbi:LacI family DNA-binding transcriptional regulator [uncultured Leifsonia sp.]|uniref:LacI family DNA-binding transcriptional regulator n=1 Tax=uncultured Leifsonia sp. TaxID=340359 RepID=UPI0025CFDCE8|nr:LacI family DNA-binding transcriptional regulator [uncultured Leifsonia sp.]
MDGDVMSSAPLTVSDIARAAGVSRATVSYVLNDRRDVRVSEPTRERVMGIARTMGYVGSPAARALRSGRGDVVLLLVPDWEVSGQLELLLEGIGRLVAEHGLVCIRHEGEHWRGSLHRLLSRISCACVVTFDPLLAEDAHALESAGIPEVTARLLDYAGLPHTTAIGQDTIVAAQVDHLLAQGYERLAYLATEEPRGQAFTQARVNAFHRICDDRGLKGSLSATVAGDRSEIARITNEWVRQSPTPLGIAAWNDLTALGIVSSAAASGISVPTQLGVIGGDDTPIAALALPSITSVEFNLQSEAKQIAIRVAQAVDHENTHTTQTEQMDAVRVIARESTSRV